MTTFTNYIISRLIAEGSLSEEDAKDAKDFSEATLRYNGLVDDAKLTWFAKRYEMQCANENTAPVWDLEYGSDEMWQRLNSEQELSSFYSWLSYCFLEEGRIPDYDDYELPHTLRGILGDLNLTNTEYNAYKKSFTELCVLKGNTPDWDVVE